MGFKSFEDIVGWQRAQDLAVLIYKEFGTCKDYGFKDQICRAVVSISNNIAEGFDRSSDKEFVRFLYISKGSCSEVKSMLYLAPRLGIIPHKNAIVLNKKADEVGKILSGLIKNLKSRYA
jgi:four helix bundle protein